MPSLPESVKDIYIAGLNLIHRGKVRDTYALPGYPERLLVVASDRVSIFDFVLPALIPSKGEVLTALNHYWRTQVIGDAFPHDLVAAGAEIDAYLPTSLQGNRELQARATVVRKLCMIPVEAIARAYLTGSGLSAYQDKGEVCGHRLPSGLHDGSELPWLLFTPTTKAEEGHDEAISADGVAGTWGVHVERSTLQLFTRVSKAALEQGIILADTKLEFGYDSRCMLTLADEVFTPDSSRFWYLEEWKRASAAGRSPSPHDKQAVRDWGKGVGIHRCDPKKPEDVAWVHAQQVPPDVLTKVEEIYAMIFMRLTGKTLQDYQMSSMGIVQTV